MNIKPDQVYVTNRYNDEHKRIVAIFGRYIYYSNGGNINKACLKSTFIRWIKVCNASMLIEGAH